MALDRAPKKRPATALGVDWQKRPGMAESLIPVWGSAREAIADAHEGDILGAVGNGVLAVTDLVPAKAVGGVALKVATKAGRQALVKTGSHTHGATRKWLAKTGQVQPGDHAHHWLVPNSGWGKHVPESIKNQPWNYLPVKPEVHKRLHGEDLKRGLPEFNVLQKAVHGTPTWAKGAAVYGTSRAGQAGNRD